MTIYFKSFLSAFSCPSIKKGDLKPERNLQYQTERKYNKLGNEKLNEIHACFPRAQRSAHLL